MKKIFIVALALTFLSSNAQIGQPEKGLIFDDSNVSRIDIIIDQDSLDQLLLEENWYEDHEYPADMIFQRDNQVDTVYQVGFRLRGNTSRAAEKKSFKIAINSFVSGKRYYGLKKINLNGEHNDPSIARSKLNWDLLRDNQLPSTRVSHTEFYINDEYKGLYINVEHINDDFLMLRYGNNGGNLYKCGWPANLHYISSNPDDYKIESNGKRVYELKTNETEDDYSDFAHFIDVLNNTPSNDLYCELSKVFDIEDFLEILAIDVLTGNWDGANFNKNNFYLYHNTRTDRFQFIPYDLDNTLGIDWFGVDWTQRNIYNWSPSWDYLPLYERLMANSEAKKIYSYFLKETIEQLNQSSFPLKINELRDLIAPYAINDIYRTLDYGFSFSDFLNSYSQNIPYDHVDSGIKPFYINRNNSANSQLNLQNISPIIRYIQTSATTTQTPVYVKAFVEDESLPQEVMAYTEYNGLNNTLQLYDDGMHGDGDALDGWYANSAGIFTEPGVLQIQIQATDIESNVRLTPCEPLSFEITSNDGLVINEFMAKNDTTIQDNMGDYSDWVEIYNSTDESINLSGYFLTDDLSENTKWAFPETTLETQGFYLVWCSGETTHGENHGGFKLSADGEDLGLFKSEADSIVLVDGLTFGPQTADVSYGRETDAAPAWTLFTVPTPNAPNGIIDALADINPLQTSILVYPNPYSEGFNMSNPSDRPFSIEILDVTGRLMARFKIKPFENMAYMDRGEAGVRFIRWYADHQSGVIRVIKE